VSKRTDPLATASSAIESAMKMGAQEAEAYVRSARDLSISLRNNEVESVKQANTLGLGLRVTVDSRTLLVHATSLTGIGVLKLAEQAVEMTRALPAPKEPTLFARPAEASEQPHQDPDLASETHDAKVARLREIERAMLAVKGVTASGGIAYDETDGDIALVNSLGVKRYAPICRIEIGADAIAESGGDSSSGGRYTAACGRQYLLNAETLGREAGQRAVEMLGARPVPSARVPVIFTPHVGWALLAYTVAPTRGDNVMRGRSYLADQIGQTIAAERVTIIDDPLMREGAGRRAFDGEGTPCRKLPIIENGVLKNYLTDLASAQALGVGPGGNTARSSYSARPEIGTSTHYMRAGDVPPQEIIRQTQRGLLLTSLSGWWVGLSPVTDTFSSAAMGFWIEKGEIAHPVKGITVGGNVREMLKAIDLVGNDLAFTHESNTPTFRVAEMSVSGT
jgi:PmbA protein